MCRASQDLSDLLAFILMRVSSYGVRSLESFRGKGSLSTPPDQCIPKSMRHAASID